ncbi:importin subunit beta-1-like isoform X2 [Magnolia sinica]|uniref:importin subunit beta-1-like isoform X2 n=1 Tax=Magnolia sinica TaxID=86752 RepID=UPI00265B12C7|nr:importin subunit beta-1-like isoform X2 [Magnolia sinica]
MAMEVTQILLNAQAVDGTVRKHAEETLKQFQDQNLPGFLFSLSGELANNDKPVDSRKLAGLILKNTLDAKEQHRKFELVQRWLSLDSAVKAQIKGCLLQTLSSPVLDARSTASQVIAKIAGIELPHNQWPDLITSLLSNINQLQVHVKQATLETLGYLCEEVSSDVIDQEQVNKILTAVVQCMNSSEGSTDVRLAATRALYNALGFAHANFTNDMERDYIMRVVCEATLCPEDIVQALLTVTHREDAGDSRLQTAAYETLNEVIRCSTDETAPTVMQLVPVIMMELNQTIDAQKLSSEEREKQNELQGLLCGCLQVIIQKLGGSEATKHIVIRYADQMMSLFMQVFACRNATVHEEAMLAIGALAYSTGADFSKYMLKFYPYLEIGLQNFEEYQVCSITVGVIGDLCRALEEKILPYCDGIMIQLLKDLSSNQLHRSVKPPIFSCFGDIALAIGENFGKYLIYAMPMLQSAGELSAPASGVDDEVSDYTNVLRNGILEAYSGIFQGFKNSPKTQLLMPYAPHILQFLDSLYMAKDMDAVVTKTAIGVLGDLADTLGNNAGPLINQVAACKEFLDECLFSGDPSIKESADWARVAVMQAISG